MNAKIMPLVEMRFNCAPVATEPRETFHDPDMGDLTVGPMIEPERDEPATVEHDVDLGPIVVRARPDCHGGRRYTGPPVADLAFICFVAASIACTCLAACGLALAAGR